MFSSLGGAAANPSQVAENMPSALVGLASAVPGTATEQTPKYGLAMRFVVRVNECGNLGRWSTCQGLRVDFKPVSVNSGGDYTELRWLPGAVEYQKIVLKRAVEPKSSQAIQNWLAKAARLWITGENDNDQPGDATITLLNAEDKGVITWTLHNVRPWAWSGPELDAATSKVAIETLELVHEGFEVLVHGGKPAPASTGRSASRADKPETITLSEASAIGAHRANPQSGATTGASSPNGGSGWVRASPGRSGQKEVQFKYNPTEIGISRTIDSTVFKAQDGEDISSGPKAGITTLTMNGVQLVPTAVPRPSKPKDAVELLLDWMTPIGSRKTQEDKTEPVLQRLNLKWGKGFNYEVELRTVSATYTRFDNAGNPLRAKVNLTFTVIREAKQPGTNPTSGGIPGRSAHTLLLGENLPLLASQHYGNTSRWRDIADANGIDDPLRIRPGRTIFLPAAAELSRRR